MFRSLLVFLRLRREIARWRVEKDAEIRRLRAEVGRLHVANSVLAFEIAQLRERARAWS